MPAGLDSFWQLTDRIVTALDATPARKRLDEGWDFDRIFYLLERDFDRSEIDREIFKALGKFGLRPSQTTGQFYRFRKVRRDPHNLSRRTSTHYSSEPDARVRSLFHPTCPT